MTVAVLLNYSYLKVTFCFLGGGLIYEPAIVVNIVLAVGVRMRQQLYRFYTTEKGLQY